MLWKRYVFRRGPEVHDLWDGLFDKPSIRLLYIGGRGFDVRAQLVLRDVVKGVLASGATIASAKMVLVGFGGHELAPELHDLTASNAIALKEIFAQVGECEILSIGKTADGEDDISASNALRLGTERVLAFVGDHTDIVLDVSSMPRVAYLSILTGLLQRLIPNRLADDVLVAGGVNLQVLVGEDSGLDAAIRSEDPANELILIPGYSTVLHAESVLDWPCVWFPILGENRVGQLEKVLASSIPDLAEICPVLPHPCRNPRRGDQLLIEYMRPLFESGRSAVGNVLYAHESNPFEAYRQLLSAMRRYRESLAILGGSRLVVTPLGSKLITIGAGLACFDMRPTSAEENYGVAIPYAGPTRYLADPASLKASRPSISALLLTGDAYRRA